MGKCYHVSTWGGRLRVGLDNPAVLWDSYVLVQCSLVLPMRGGSPLTPGDLVTADHCSFVLPKRRKSGR